MTTRTINIRRGFLQGDSFSPVGFCLTEVPIGMMLEEAAGYKMGGGGERDCRITHMTLRCTVVATRSCNLLTRQ